MSDNIVQEIKKPFKSKEVGSKILGATIGAIIVLGISEVFKDRPSLTGQIPYIGTTLAPAAVPVESEAAEGGAF